MRRNAVDKSPTLGVGRLQTMIRRHATRTHLPDRWAVRIQCPHCGRMLLSATDIAAEPLLTAHRRFGCRRG